VLLLLLLLLVGSQSCPSNRKFDLVLRERDEREMLLTLIRGHVMLQQQATVVLMRLAARV